MSRSLWLHAGMLLALLSAFPARAASDADLEEIRAQIRDLKQTYEARIQALEQRLKEAEAKPAPSSPAPAPAPTPALVATAPRSGASSSGLAAFNPAISAILTGTYANLSGDPERWRLRGFAAGGDIGPGKRGFSLGESEIAFSANVDHKFSGNLIFSITPDDTVAVEEAYGIFNGAPAGIVPKFGRFLSGFGYLNEQHAHVWDFVDAPLAYQAFLGGQYRTDGVQLSWIAPTEHFVQLGAELGNGEAFPGAARNRNGANAGVLFARTGGDVGESHNWLAGLSYLRTNAEARAFAAYDPVGDEVPMAFTGRSEVAAADFVWKYAPNGNPHDTNLKVQAEYLWRRERGSAFPDLPGAGLPSASDYRSRQSGWYVQGVYQFMPQWRAGLRYDRLDRGSVDYAANDAFFRTPSGSPERASAMIDWSPSEFSRVRVQYARVKLAPDFTDNEWFVQYILSLGAHGAHKY